MKLQQCSLGDVSLLARMNQDLQRDEDFDKVFSLEKLEKRMEDFLESSYEAWFFIIDKYIIGYALIDMSMDPYYLRQFFIDKSARRKGYGRLAMELLINELNCNELELDVLCWNQPARDFYLALGFADRSCTMRWKRSIHE